MKSKFTFLVFFLLSISAYCKPELIFNTKDSGVIEHSSDSIIFEGLKNKYCINENIEFSLNFQSYHTTNLVYKIYLNYVFETPYHPESQTLFSKIFKDFVSFTEKDKIYKINDELGNVKCFITIENDQKEIISKSSYFYTIQPLAFVKYDAKSLPLACNDNPITLESYFSFGDYGGKGSFIWQKDGVDLINEKSNFISINDPGVYSIKIQNEVCEFISNGLKVNFNEIEKPLVLSNISSKNLCEGSEVRLTAFNSLAFSKIEWYLNGKTLETDKNEIIAKKTGYYHLEVSKNTCVSKSDSIYLNFENAIENQIGVISNFGAKLESNTISICKSDFVNIFSKIPQTSYVNVYSLANISPNLLTVFKENYESQWQKNGTDIPSETNFMLKTNEEGIYRLKLKQKECITYSNEIVVKQSQEFISKLKISPIDYENQQKIQVFENELVIVSPNSLNYDLDKWTKSLYKNNQLLNSNENSTNIYFRFNDSGLYQLKYSEPNGSGCLLVSEPFEVELLKKEKVFKTDTLLFCQNQTLFMPLFTADLYLGYKKPKLTNNHQWFLDGQLLGIQSTLNIVKSGNYKYVGTDEEGNKSVKTFIVKDFLNLNLLENGSSFVKNSFEICEGQILNLIPEGNFQFSKFDIYKDNVLYQKDLSKISINKSGEYYVKAKIDNCLMSSSKVNLKVINPISNSIIPSADSVFYCKGGYQLLEGNSNSDQKYNWYKNNEKISSNTNVLKVNSPGIYYATMEKGNCIKKSPSKTVIEKDIKPTAAILGDTTLNFNGNAKLKLRFTSSPPFLFTINKSIPGYSEKNTMEIPIQALESKEYQITSLSNTCGEGKFSGTAKITVLVLGKEPIDDQLLKVYPNPSSEFCQISFENATSKPVKIVLSDFKGQILFTKEYEKQNEINDQLNFKEIPSGTYFLRLFVGTESFSRKIIKN